MNKTLLQQAMPYPYLDTRQNKTFHFDVVKIDRSVGASLSGAIADVHGDQGLSSDSIKAHLPVSSVKVSVSGKLTACS